jgi:hypothetical protein
LVIRASFPELNFIGGGRPRKSGGKNGKKGVEKSTPLDVDLWSCLPDELSLS